MVSKYSMRRSIFLIAVALSLFADCAYAQEKLTCDCGNSSRHDTVCLTKTEMADQVTHIEMRNDEMGNHVNARGVAVLELTVGKDGHVANAKAISGHPLALSLLLGAIQEWRFKPLIRNKTARQECGRLNVEFSIVENLSEVEVVR